MSEKIELKKIASQIRRDILRMVHQNSSGHPGGSLGCTDILTALYFEIMDHNPDIFEIDGKGQDLFFLSNGHISPAWYSVLARRGYFPLSELSTFRSLNSRLQGHPTPEEGLPGIRIASGSLGQGLSAASGAALSKKLNGESEYVYCLTGDGELQEGQVWEAAMFAAQHKIDNLIAIVDYNHKQIDGPIEEVIDLKNLRAKWEAFGWNVLEMDGNSIEDVLKRFQEAKKASGNGKPIVILAHTIMGKGVDFMEGKHQWHGVAPNDEQLASALAQLPESLGDY